MRYPFGICGSDPKDFPGTGAPRAYLGGKEHGAWVCFTFTAADHDLEIALAAEATFVARTYDANPKHMAATFLEASKHKGVSFIEILQNCPIFNDGAWTESVDKKVRNERLIELEHGKPLVYGDNKGLKLEGLRLVPTSWEGDEVPAKGIASIFVD